MADIFGQLEDWAKAMAGIDNPGVDKNRAIDDLCGEDVIGRVNSAIEKLHPDDNLTKEQAAYAISWIFGKHGDYPAIMEDIELTLAKLHEKDILSGKIEAKKRLDYAKGMVEVARDELDCTRNIYLRCPDITPSASHWLYGFDIREKELHVYERTINNLLAMESAHPAKFQEIFPTYAQLVLAICTSKYEEANSLKKKILDIEPRFTQWPDVQEDRVKNKEK